jgi:hypothetical protein
MVFDDPPPALATDPALNLARDPFAPELQLPGGAVRFPYAGSGPLDPRAGHLGLYLDLYDWPDAGKVGGMAPNGRLSALERANPQQAMVLLVSGFGGCGRSSAINLLLYEIENYLKNLNQHPIIVSYRTQIISTCAQHAADIAGLLARQVSRSSDDGKALADILKETLKEWTGNVVPNSKIGPNPDNLFQMLRDDIPSERRVVVILDAVNHEVSSDIWQSICRALSQLADFIIVSLSERKYADLFRSIFGVGEFQVGRVDAPKTTEAKMAKLLAVRLGHERIIANTDPASLVPFTPEALNVLYRPSGNRTETVEWSITAAMRALAGAWVAKSRALAATLAEGRRPTPDEIAITAKDMEDYIAKYGI